MQSLHEVQAAIQNCSKGINAPTAVHVSKMFAVPASALPRQPGDPAPSDPRKEVFLAFGRVFSGSLRNDQVVHVLSAAYTPVNPDKHRQEVKVNLLFCWTICNQCYCL